MALQENAPVDKEDQVYADLIHALVVLNMERQKAAPDLEKAFALTLRCEAYTLELKNLTTRLRLVPYDEIEQVIDDTIDVAIQPLEDHLVDDAIAVRAESVATHQMFKEKRVKDVTRRSADDVVALLTNKIEEYMRESAKRYERIRRIEWMLNESTIEEHINALRMKLEANNVKR